MRTKKISLPVKTGTFILMFALIFSLSCNAATKKMSSRPNIVFILVDDMGWKDLGCYGSTFYETPHIDKLASQGMKFLDAYASSTVCSPSRSSIMTGQYPVHTGITDWIIGRQNSSSGPSPNQKLLPKPFVYNLDTAQVTIAEALKRAGYATCFAGKWHLGLSPEYWPENQGFDYNYGGWAAGNPRAHGMGGYFSPYHNPRLKDGPKGEFLPDRLTTEIIRFIKQQVKTGKPFFADLSFYAVHEPIKAKKEYIEKFKEKARRMGLDTMQQFIKLTPGMQETSGWKTERIVQSNPVYAGLIYSIDENVGRILTTLEKLGIADNTIIVFTSDNGGLSTSSNAPTTNYPLRYGKGWTYDGGIRIPLIIKWPGVTREGTVCRFPVVNTDFYPTLLQMTGLPLMPQQHKDGISLVPLLMGKQNIDQAVIYWHYPHYHGAGCTPGSAIRAGDWKLLQFYEDNHVELYNLRTDIEERRDLSKAFPGKTAILLSKLNHWKYKVHAKIPWINPYYNPYMIDHYIKQYGRAKLPQYLRKYDSLFSKDVYDPALRKSLMEQYHKLYNLR